jgi:hypothetical protein
MLGLHIGAMLFNNGRGIEMNGYLGRVLMAILLMQVCTPSAWAQDKGTSTLASGISMRIEAPKSSIKVGDDLSIKVTISNGTNEFLTLGFVPSLSIFGIHIRDAEGKMPKETEEGCRRHRSESCAGQRQNGGSGSLQFMYVLPGKEITINLDIGREYRLDYPSTFTLDVTEQGIIAVAVPPGGDIFSGKEYPHREAGLLQSNTISFQVVP